MWAYILINYVNIITKKKKKKKKFKKQKKKRKFLAPSFNTVSTPVIEAIWRVNQQIKITASASCCFKYISEMKK